MKISLQLEYFLKGREYSTYLRQCTRCGGAHKVDKTRTRLNIIFYTHSVKIYIYENTRDGKRKRADGNFNVAWSRTPRPCQWNVTSNRYTRYFFIIFFLYNLGNASKWRSSPSLLSIYPSIYRYKYIMCFTRPNHALLFLSRFTQTVNIPTYTCIRWCVLKCTTQSSIASRRTLQKPFSSDSDGRTRWSSMTGRPWEGGKGQPKNTRSRIRFYTLLLLSSPRAPVNRKRTP